MRICRYLKDDMPALGYYFDDVVVPVEKAFEAFDGPLDPVDSVDALDLLPHGARGADAEKAGVWLDGNAEARQSLGVPAADVVLQAPLPAPGKVFMLAGNYVEHIKEGGEAAVERAETFPYVFMKPANTFNHPDAAIPIPKVSPDYIDYECELAIVIGKTCKDVAEADALNYVAGYMVVNDISDRKYRPFPDRKKRDRDPFFDWLHGKWHDGFCPMGPCIASAKTIPDPQTLAMKLTVNGDVRQDASTAQMVFPVAAVIEFVARSITLQPGDVIATGTPSGVGMASGRYLKDGDVLEASIAGIGVLRNVMKG